MYSANRLFFPILSNHLVWSHVYHSSLIIDDVFPPLPHPPQHHHFLDLLPTPDFSSSYITSINFFLEFLFFPGGWRNYVSKWQFLMYRNVFFCGKNDHSYGILIPYLFHLCSLCAHFTFLLLEFVQYPC